jgi:hypothetical protein
LQLRKAAASLYARCGNETAPRIKEYEMRTVETAAIVLVTLAAQMIVVATVLM